jgi:hypothetical protein
MFCNLAYSAGFESENDSEISEIYSLNNIKHALMQLNKIGSVVVGSGALGSSCQATELQHQHPGHSMTRYDQIRT